MKLTNQQARDTAKYIRDHWDPRWELQVRIADGFH